MTKDNSSGLRNAATLIKLARQAPSNARITVIAVLMIANSLIDSRRQRADATGRPTLKILKPAMRDRCLLSDKHNIKHLRQTVPPLMLPPSPPAVRRAGMGGIGHEAGVARGVKSINKPGLRQKQH